jgi:hypothetical protein
MLLRQRWLAPCRGMLITYAAGRPKPQSPLQTGVSGLATQPFRHSLFVLVSESNHLIGQWGY